MTLVRECDVCKTSYTAKRPTSKFCSDTCRKRSSRIPKPALTLVAPTTPEPPTPAEGPLTTATLAELTAASRETSAAGQMALLLARRLDRGSLDTGSSVAALVREHRATLADAVKNAAAASDPLDEMARMRQQRRANG